MNTAQKIADEYGINEKTVRRAGKFAEEVEKDPELKQAIRVGPPDSGKVPLTEKNA